MKFYPRHLDLKQLLKQKSFFLFGPRGVGKSTLISNTMDAEKITYINLLKSTDYLRYQSNPSSLEEVVDASPDRWIVIDEIQRVPELLNEVHRLIESHKTRFLLTGSSARKLRRQGINLLAGRAWRADLYPLITPEIIDFDLEKALRYGTLPAVYASENPREELDAYCEIYLKEEISQENLIRKLPPFIRFLKVAGLSSGQMINYSQIGSDTQISPNTIKQYFQVLYDTLIADEVEPFFLKGIRKSVETPKFYLFDCGVMHTLAQTEHVDRNSNLYGQAFETWMFHELKAYMSYQRRKDKIYFYRDYQKNEIDFVIGSTAIEVKATKRQTREHLKSLLQVDNKLFKEKFLVCQEETERKHQGVTVIHWKTFLGKLWKNKYKF